MTPETLPAVLENIGRYQKADGHFGREVDWNAPLEPENPNAVLLPIFWGNSRLLVGLLEAQRAFDRPDLLAAAQRIGDFYLATADRFPGNRQSSPAASASGRRARCRTHPRPPARNRAAAARSRSCGAEFGIRA
jgi:hypothetical protein